jgi:hypothetical protein
MVAVSLARRKGISAGEWRKNAVPLQRNTETAIYENKGLCKIIKYNKIYKRFFNILTEEKCR